MAAEQIFAVAGLCAALALAVLRLRDMRRDRRERRRALDDPPRDS